MPLMLKRPGSLDEDSWVAIDGHAGRLERAQRDDDLSLVIGSAKDLVETIAKIVLELSGDVTPSNADLPGLLTKTHAALDRQPGQGAATQPPLRTIVQGAKTIVSQLPELRNRFGTGHGRVVTPEVDEELASVCLDAALLWSRWALLRLDHLLAGQPVSLIKALNDDIFRRGDLRGRLQSVQLPTLDPSEQRHIGVAVAHRAMRDTFTVKDEGVEACAQQPDLGPWPAGYRIGLVEGLFLDREGYVDVSAWGVAAAASVIAPVPAAGQAIRELSAKVSEASWAYHFANDTTARDATVSAMRGALPVLPNEDARAAWNQILCRLQPDSV
jgi:Abortive infection C-terminus